MKTKFKPIPVVYLASPYSPQNWFERLPVISSIIKYLRYRQITKVAAKLTETLNVALILPITQSHNIIKYMKTSDTGFNQWKSIDLSFISKCDSVFVVRMKGWDKSIGIKAEIQYAKSKKIPVHYI